MISLLSLLLGSVSASSGHVCGATQNGKGITGSDVAPAQQNVANIQACCDACAGITGCIISIYDGNKTCSFKNNDWKPHCVAAPGSFLIPQIPIPSAPTPAPKPPPGPAPGPADLGSYAQARPCSVVGSSLGGPGAEWNTGALAPGRTESTIKLADLNMCLDCGSCTNASRIRTGTCDGSAGQSYDVHADMRISPHSQPTMCIGASNCTYDDGMVWLSIMPCDTSNPMQVIDVTHGSALAVKAAGNQYGVPGVDDSCFAANAINCDNQIKGAAVPATASVLRPWCNASLDSTTRAVALIAQMTMREKRANLGTGGSMSPGSSAARGPYWGEALHGLEEDCGQSYPFAAYGGNSTGCPTSFPHGTALGSTFNRTLWSSIGTAMGAEARGMWNQQKGPIWFFSPPDVNLARDPRWGRAQEVAGEDPFLNGEFGIAIASHLEHPVLPEAPAVGPGGPYRAAISCTKHYAAYDCENCKPCDKRTMDSYFNYTTDPNQLYCDRQHFNAIIPDQDIVDYFLPSFRAVIESNVSSSVMCSYNDINGVPSCGNSFTLTHMLREEWGFDGFVISDCGALINFNFEAYKFSKLGNDTARHVAAVMNGGCDSGCDALLNNNVTYALQKGTVTPETVDTALLRLYRKYVETGQLDGEVKNAESFGMFGPQTVDTPQHRALALEAAQQATILLQNNVPTGKTAPLLPLKSGTKIAIIGPHSTSTKNLLSIYVGGNLVVLNQTMLKAITRAAAAHGSSVVGHNLGCANDTSGSQAKPPQPWMDRNEIACKNTSYFKDSVALAKNADVVLLFMGLAPTSGAVGIAGETEGCDRPDDFSLPNKQTDLVAAITAANPNVVLTIIHGSASISLEDEKISCPAIVDAHYPGQMGGDAIASILFGDVSPSARLSTTMYPLDFVNQRNISDMGLLQKGGITYKHYTGKPTFTFGHGLSYTTFTFEHVSTFGSRHVVTAAALAADDRRFYRGRHAAGSADFATRSASAAPAASYDVKVTNTGSVASAVVVLGFVNSSHADAPVNTELFDFARVPMLAAGASTTVTLAMTPAVLATVDTNGVQSILPGTYTVRFGVEGAAETQTASATLIVQGEYTLFNLPAARSTHKANMAKKFGDTAEVHYDW